MIVIYVKMNELTDSTVGVRKEAVAARGQSGERMKKKAEEFSGMAAMMIWYAYICVQVIHTLCSIIANQR